MGWYCRRKDNVLAISVQVAVQADHRQSRHLPRVVKRSLKSALLRRLKSYSYRGSAGHSRKDEVCRVRVPRVG